MNIQLGSRLALAEATNPSGHSHVCHICAEAFRCANGDDCAFEDRYAVCFKQECIDEFEKPEEAS